MNKNKYILDENSLFVKMAKLCSKTELCEKDIKLKLLRKHYPYDLITKIIEKLKKENFINEDRYINAFINDKLNLNHWGKNKIKYELEKKEFDKNLIKQKLNNIDNELYFKILTNIVNSKFKQIDKNDYLNKIKIFRYLYNKGFEKEIIQKIININENL